MATLLLFLLLLQIIAAMAHQSNVLHPHCKEVCGDERIPYPFGLGHGCYRDNIFEITCKSFDDGTMQPFSGGNSRGNSSTLRVFNFSVSQSQASMFKHITYHCYNATGPGDPHSSDLDLGGSPFTISVNRNKFTAMGCNTMAYITSGTSKMYASGCMSFCNIHNLNNTISSSCTGIRCCQTSLPENLVDYHSGFYERSINDTTWKFNPCGYSFVADQTWVQLNSSYLEGEILKLEFKKGVPLALDWVVGNVTCDEAKDSSLYACRSSNSAATPTIPPAAYMDIPAIALKVTKAIPTSKMVVKV